MAGGFDAELKASIRDLQSAVAALDTQTQKGNASLRQMQMEVKAVAAGHREAAGAAAAHTGTTSTLAQEVNALGRAARVTAGDSASMVGKLAGLVAVNPLAIAAGAGIGFITEQIRQLVAEAINGSKALDELLEKPQKLAEKIAELARGGAAGLDSRGLRRRALEQYTGDSDLEGIEPEARDRAYRAARGAMQAGRTSSIREGVERLQKSGALRRRESGLGPVAQVSDDQLLGIAAGSDDPGFADAFRRAQGTSEYALAEEADYAKTATATAARTRAESQAQLDSNPVIVGLLTEIRNLTAKREAAVANREGVNVKIIEQQMQERTAALEAALSTYTSASK